MKDEFEAKREAGVLFETLKYARKKADMKKTKMCEKAGVSIDSYNNIERRSNCLMTTFIRLCDACGLEIILQEKYPKGR